MARYAVIIAGGYGTRLWPLSRAARPKQLLPLIEGQSLLQIAAARMEGIAPAANRYICTAEAQRAPIRAQLRSFDDEHILGEPEGRDTVNAVGFVAAVLAQADPGAVFAVLTADHLIEPQQVLARGFDLGFRLIEADPTRLVTFSIKPTHPTPGYGYVERAEAIAGFEGAYRVKRFVEKPETKKAAEIIAAGGGWNSGMFVFPAAKLLEAIQWFAPQSHEGLMKIASAWNTPHRAAVLQAVYPTLPKKSVDYAVMEPASRDSRLTVCTVPLDLKWLDVGSWSSYAQTLPAGEGPADGNRSPKSTRAVHLGSRGIIAISDEPAHTITTIGCEDLIIVHTKDATLVCRADQTEKVKEMAKQVDEKLR